MLANTLSLTIGTDPAITLTRRQDDKGESYYYFGDSTKVINVTFRNEVRTNKSSGDVMNVFNGSLVYEEADTPTVLGKTYTASFTGQYSKFGVPLLEVNINKALHVLAATILSQLANGEV